jgi:alkyl sulfatase BDS1-like metallo-beta-lactamase superfamily hydrolase
MKTRIRPASLLTIIAVAITMGAAHGAEDAAGPKDATDATQKANAGLSSQLPFGDREDFELAQRGLIAKAPATVPSRRPGVPVAWDLAGYAFITPDAPAPATVNPSLWRQAQLNMNHGLFKVVDRIYQVRGLDISNVSFIEGDTGWIVVDPLISVEVAKAALDLVHQHLSKKPVVAVIYTHSHGDHFGGVKAIVSEQDLKAGRVKIIAPQGFMEHAVSENVVAGSAMGRRAMYMFGPYLPKGPKGQVDTGLGKTISTGVLTLLPPTDIISQTAQTMTIDGVQFVFQYTPDTEAPAEMNFYLPQFKALCMAENANHGPGREPRRVCRAE